MIRHETKHPPLFVYPIDEWRVIETAFYPSLLPQTETIFSVGNGYLGMRGVPDEGQPVHLAGTYINRFFESWPIVYGEEAYGFARTGQTIVNVPDGRILKLYVDDEPLFLPTADLPLYRRTLDMRDGTLDRELLWETPAGKRVRVISRRLVSFEHRHLAAISYEVTLENARAPVIVSSQLVNNAQLKPGGKDPRRARPFTESPLAPVCHYSSGMRVMLGFETRRSGMSLGCGIDHAIETECGYTVDTEGGPEAGKVVFSADAEPGKPIRITKYISYHTSRSPRAKELCERAERTLDRAVRSGFSDLLEGQRAFLGGFWERSDVEIRGHPETAVRPLGEFQQAIRWNLFQILQATARTDGLGVPAKGLTGQAYDGQYFWDTEIYVQPFLLYTEPRIVRNLLRSRHGMLDQARIRARELHHQGALFPWRTINGEEASAYYAAGTAQYHINADIAYALKKYVLATGDVDFLFDEGAEILVETARMWTGLGFYSERRGGRFCIHAVTGPDEYTTVVDNNTYTNLMARENLRFAAETVESLRRAYPERYEDLVHRTGILESETEEWRRAAEAMYVPYDEALGIHPQDDDFLEHEVWDFAATPEDNYPLLLHYHPLVIYRHQVIKQADIVLAMFLLGGEFPLETKRRNFDYYDPLTTGDSSLSACIQAIVAAEIGRMDKALEYARYAVLMDLADVGENVADGVHIASAGGTWMVLVCGFGGMRDYGGELTFRPRLPKVFAELRFPLVFQGRRLRVTVRRQSATYELVEGDILVITHCQERVRLRPREPVTLPVAPADECGDPGR